jgi:DNA-binding CsgD family transcriptional regulator
MPISQKKNRMKGLIRERGASWELRVCLGRDPLAGSNPTIRAPSWQQRVRVLLGRVRSDHAAGRSSREATDFPAVHRRPERSAGRFLGAWSPGGLSRRELEVLQLVADGLSTREIAGQLFVSVKSADHHIQHIYTKIAVSNRAAATRWAVDHGVSGAATA